MKVVEGRLGSWFITFLGALPLTNQEIGFVSRELDLHQA